MLRRTDIELRIHVLGVARFWSMPLCGTLVKAPPPPHTPNCCNLRPAPKTSNPTQPQNSILQGECSFEQKKTRPDRCTKTVLEWEIADRWIRPLHTSASSTEASSSTWSSSSDSMKKLHLSQIWIRKFRNTVFFFDMGASDTHECIIQKWTIIRGREKEKHLIESLFGYFEMTSNHEITSSAISIN